MKNINSEVYNALAEIMFQAEVKGEEVTKEDMQKALDWFMKRFWEDVEE